MPKEAAGSVAGRGGGPRRQGGRERGEASSLPLPAEIKVKLGDRIAVTGYGLDATVTGQLLVRESPGSPPPDRASCRWRGVQGLRPGSDHQGWTAAVRRYSARQSAAGDRRDARDRRGPIHRAAHRRIREAAGGHRHLDPNVGEADALSYLVTGVAE